MGGYTARSRDREMIRLLDDTFNRAKVNPNLIARTEVPWQQIASNSRSAPITAGFDVNTAPSTAVAQANPDYVAKRWTLFASMNQAVNPKAVAPKYPDEDEGAAQSPAPVPTPRPEPAAPVQIANNYPQTLVSPQVHNTDNEGEGDAPDDARATAAAMGARAWAIQIGAFATDALAKAELASYTHRSSDLLKTTQQVVIPVQSAHGHSMYRARFGPMAERDAREICARLTERGQTCFATMSAR